MTQSIGEKPWMKPAAPVMEALEAVGGPGCARFVGGAVRNTLLGQPVGDVDIACTLTPDQATKALEAAGIKVAPTGVDHGTVTAIVGGEPFEVTTLRRDVETDGRRAVVAFTEDWAEDAQRRDFTMNAVYADRLGNLTDPTGTGVADAQAGRLVFVGEAATRIAEDSLRILRYFRFLAWYGKGEPDAAALAACEAGRELMGNLAAERVAKELLKLVAAYDPRPATALMAKTGVLAQLLPSATDLGAFDQLVEVETEQLFTCDALLRLATLLPDNEVGIGKAAEALRLSNEQRDRLIAAMGKTPRITSWMSPRESRRAVYKIGVQAFSDRIKLAWAHSERSAATHQWRGLLALAESWTPPPFPLTGEDVLKSGVPKGPMVGQVLREVEDWWIDHDFIDDKFSAIEKLKAVAQGMAY
ncbi:CCA tRNA nucleotidyltransferase [Phenylobacterium sp. LjRoot164]|uniref:CCA tRNA nucleotidyltransferase n=1 Tax=unclassified Phenylobacterium TaxID=2640670 RepID=UPI003ED0E94D